MHEKGNIRVLKGVAELRTGPWGSLMAARGTVYVSLWLMGVIGAFVKSGWHQNCNGVDSHVSQSRSYHKSTSVVCNNWDQAFRGCNFCKSWDQAC